ncbi:hypothetical protein AB0C13_09230 [Streptomyces sp. NPDC049099]|uniref:type II toxin-antitoxin system RelE family toxin n=1 Tax=Streptomyces sp. NPDC049099 TaxID=3155768 RepID=UPI00341A9A56
MTGGGIKVGITGDAQTDFRMLEPVLSDAAHEAIQRLQADPQHPALCLQTHGNLNRLLTIRLNAEYRALIFRVDDDRWVILSVEHRHHVDRFTEATRRFIHQVEQNTVVVDFVGETAEVARAADAPTPFAEWTTALASRLAGSGRAHLHDDWSAVLAGDPEGGVALRPNQQRMLAAGFVLAACRLRVRDNVRPLWRPVDWLLRVPSRTNAFITAVVGGQAVFIVGDDGLAALLTDVWEPCGVAGASLFGLARWLRRVRGVELAASGSDHVEE